MKEIIDAKVSAALYYLVLDFLDCLSVKERFDYMNKFGEDKVIYLTLEQFNILVKDAVSYFSEKSVKDN